jgi:2-polyprenyl-3-methyl-5-hydroxy-6-metoxy-1,4-benzoquinol methylase
MKPPSDVLLERYDRHYARLNPSVNPSETTRRQLRQMERTFGYFVDQLQPGSHILDLGCGTGALLHWVSARSDFRVSGVDASRSQAGIARRALARAEIACQDGLEFLRQRRSSFSCIFCIDVLEHVPLLDDCVQWVQAAKEALRTGGVFICRVPNAANLLGTYSRYTDLTHRRSFTTASLLQLLDAGGLERCAVIPCRAGWLGGDLRQYVERAAHALVFRLCGNARETVFTVNVGAVGYRMD